MWKRGDGQIIDGKSGTGGAKQGKPAETGGTDMKPNEMGGADPGKHADTVGVDRKSDQTGRAVELVWACNISKILGCELERSLLPTFWYLERRVNHINR